eukprot:jgi/Chlat1/6289/Chrsp44S05783
MGWTADGPGAAWAVTAAALLVRLCVALHPWSGKSTPPMYGDLEAQRHWMEVTTSLPIRDWYTETEQNNLTYWGLDYPPLTAYQSWAHGSLLRMLQPQAVNLTQSRGHEEPLSILLLRWTVASSDLLIFFPAAYAFVTSFYKERTASARNVAYAILVLQPALILIDHGHFQYNCISLGLALAAIAAFSANLHDLGAVLYCLSLNHKQMSAYYAPAIFAYMLGHAFSSWHSLLATFPAVFAVVGTFAVCWAPYLHSTDSILQVLTRLVPVQRGLYEDYVANFWCATSPFIKWKQLYDVETLTRFCITTTLAACVPAMLHQIIRPSTRGLVYALFNCSLAFFLFAFQVHEKSILLPLLPAAMLSYEEPALIKWLAPLAAFSMYPLLKRDGLTLAYACVVIMYLAIFEHGDEPDEAAGEPASATLHTKLRFASLSLLLVLHLLEAFIPPPERYPFLHPALFSAMAFVHFALIGLYMNWRQWMSPVGGAAAVPVEVFTEKPKED